MSIIKDFRDDRARRMPFGSRGQVTDESLPKTTPKILDLTKLCGLVDDVLQHARTKSAGIEKNRKWDYCYEAPVGRLLGFVDKPTWVFMLESAIEFAIESRSAVQPNGRWELFDWEHSVEDRGIQQRRTVGQTREGKPEMLEQIIVEKYIIVGMRFIDVVDGEELQYEMGRPTTNKGLTADSLKKMISNGGGGGLTAEDREAFGRQQEEIKRQEMEIEMLKEQLSKSNALMAGILQEMQKEKVVPSKKKAKK